MKRRKSFAAQFHFVFGVLMAFIYVGAGLFLLINHSNNRFASIHPNVLGGILIAYGGFRCWKIYRANTESQAEAKENEE